MEEDFAKCQQEQWKTNAFWMLTPKEKRKRISQVPSSQTLADRFPRYADFIFEITAPSDEKWQQLKDLQISLPQGGLWKPHPCATCFSNLTESFLYMPMDESRSRYILVLNDQFRILDASTLRNDYYRYACESFHNVLDFLPFPDYYLSLCAEFVTSAHYVLGYHFANRPYADCFEYSLAGGHYGLVNTIFEPHTKENKYSSHTQWMAIADEVPKTIDF